MEEPKLFGDYTESMLKKIGAEHLVKAYERVTGKPCGCANRRQAMNNIHRAIRGIPQVAQPPSKPHIPPTAPIEEQ